MYDTHKLEINHPIPISSIITSMNESACKNILHYKPIQTVFKGNSVIINIQIVHCHRMLN